MFRRYFGFTLAETVIAMFIVGILFLVTFNVTKQKLHDYRRHYISAYNAINRAYYNGFVVAGHNPFTENSTQPIVHSETKDTGTEILCRALSTYINTSSIDMAKDYDKNCSSTKITNQMAKEFSDKNVQFTAANGMKFYLSNLIAGNSDLPFYLIFVDLNGDKKPNSIIKEKSNPDIVVFAALSTGRIVPIGRPEYDSTYMTARLTYTDESGQAVFGNKSLPFYQAKGQAWGFYSNSSVDVMSDINRNEPFTLNDLIRSNIKSGSNILKDFPSLATFDPMPIQDAEPTFCTAKDFDTCYVTIDDYVY